MQQKESRKGAHYSLPELLAPAGSFEKLVTAIHYGADAVYLGGKNYSLRAKAGNFSIDEMAEAIAYAHQHQVKVYVTVNIFAHNADLAGLDSYLQALAAIQADALIVADPGIVMRARTLLPDMPIHLSTQANITNTLSAHFWQNQGVRRLNLARELSLVEICAFRREISSELEIFTHGALCISYSGRCMLSNYMTGRDANQGNCAHPCRYSYALMEEKRPGQYFPVEEDDRGTYIFNSKDLCLLERLPLLMAAGVDSLKIEGRMKSIFYVGGTVRVYRAALDYLDTLPKEAWRHPETIQLPQVFIEEILRTGTRGITENFLQNKPGPGDMNYLTSRSEQEYEPIAVVKEGGETLAAEVRNTLHAGEEGQYMDKGIGVRTFMIDEMIAKDGSMLEKANPGDVVRLRTRPNLVDAQKNAIIRRKKSANGENSGEV